MAESIEREARYIDINKISIPKGFFNDLNVPKLFDWLNSQPAADVVEVVRCKNCKHRYVPARCALWYATMNDKEYFVERGENFYCSYGERKTEQ